MEQEKRAVRVAYLVSHPIQYQAPLLRRIAQEPDIDLTVFFGSDFSVHGYQDRGFGVDVKWDVPLLDGYKYEFLPVLRDKKYYSLFSPVNRGIFSRLRGRNGAHPFDVLWIHGYASINALQGMVAAKALGIPVLLRAETWLGERPRHAVVLAIKACFFTVLRQLIAGALPIGTLNEAYWRRYLGEATPMSGVPYAVDNQYFQERSKVAATGRSALQAELNLEPGRPVILFASKLLKRKRCEDLVSAYAALSPSPGSDPHPYLVIVGDGDERLVLEGQVAATGLRSVRFCGFKNQSELPRFFDLASVFVLPSRHEAWGLIVNEVMNAGRAIILTDEVGCQPDLVTEGIEGCVFPAGDVIALTQALRRVLKTPETAAEMGRNALLRINEWSFEEDVRGLRRAITMVTRRPLP